MMVSKQLICAFLLGSIYGGDFPERSLVENLPATAGDVGLIPGSWWYPEEGNGNLYQYSCMGNHMDRGAWQGTVHGMTKESDKV